MSYLETLKNDSVKAWKKDGIQYFILQHPMFGHYCGYCVFPVRPLIEQGYRGIVSYVPVHGGVTYAGEEKSGEMIYGFDCAHADDENDPDLRDLDFLARECERMAKAIHVAMSFERDYLLSPTDERKIEVLEAYHEALRQHEIFFNLDDNFGALINVLFGGI